MADMTPQEELEKVPFPSESIDIACGEGHQEEETVEETEPASDSEPANNG